MSLKNFLIGGLFGIGILLLLVLGILVGVVLPMAFFIYIAQYSGVLAITLFVLTIAFILGGIKGTNPDPCFPH